MSDCSFQSFEELSQGFEDLKRRRKLHPLAERRLASLLQDIYPDAYPKAEPGEMPGGRADLAFYFGSGHYAVFELFATVSQAAQDLRHLEQSNAQARIAVLTDPDLDGGKIFEAYFSKRPRNPFPWVKLSDILVSKNEAAAKKRLKQYIDEAFATDKRDVDRVEDIESLLEKLKLGDESDEDFGRSEYTRNLGFLISPSVSLSPASHYVILVASPLDGTVVSATNVLVAARNMLQLKKWYSNEGNTKPPPKYWPHSIFRIPASKRRAARRTLFWEDVGRPFEKNLVQSRLAITSSADVVFASAVRFVDMLEDGTPIFRIGTILAQYWRLSGLVAQLYHDIGYTGRSYLCIGMVKTLNSHLGDYAGNHEEPYGEMYWADVARGHDWSCHSLNLKFCKAVDVMNMRPKEQPEFIRDFAEEISLAYNHDNPRCLDEAGLIPQRCFKHF